MCRDSGRRWIAGALVVLSFGAAACGGGSDDAVADSTAASSSTTSTTETAVETERTSTSADTTTETSSTTTGSATTGSDAAIVADVSELRTWLGADRLVTRSQAGVVANGGESDLELTDDFPGVYAEHLFDDGTVTDYAGRPVCPDLELLGDFTVIDDVEGTGDEPIVFIEDRRFLATDVGTGTVSIPRWRHDCATGETIEVRSTTTVESRPDLSIVTTMTPGGLTLVTEWGLGDSPLRLSTGSGTVLIHNDALAYDFLLSTDETTIFATTYAGTGAASPPNGVIAIDVATGAQRWRRDVGGFVWAVGDHLVIEEVEPQISDLGLFLGREIVIVDPANGADLDRIGFTDRIVGVF